QGLVLGLPAEARDGAVVAAAIGVTRHAIEALDERVVTRVVEDCGIGNRLDETRAQYRSRDAKHDVGVSAPTAQAIPGRGKDRLRNTAAGRVAAARDDEQVMDADIGHEARLAERFVRYQATRHRGGRATSAG